MEDFKVRLLEEYKELEKRFIKLNEFLSGEMKVSERQAELLHRQAYAMEKYLEALQLRLIDLGIEV